MPATVQRTSRRARTIRRTSAKRGFPYEGGLRIRIVFPNCLQVDVNGNPHLESADDVSHLSYESARSGNPTLCPDSHPYRIPQVSYTIGYDVPRASARRLASDADGVHGASLHADSFASWDEETMNRVVHCNVESRRECQFVGRDADGGPTYRDQQPERFASPDGEVLYRQGTVLLPEVDRTPFGTRLTPTWHDRANDHPHGHQDAHGDG